MHFHESRHLRRGGLNSRRHGECILWPHAFASELRDRFRSWTTLQAHSDGSAREQARETRRGCRRTLTCSLTTCAVQGFPPRTAERAPVGSRVPEEPPCDAHSP